MVKRDPLVQEIEQGVVVDHIPAGAAWSVLKILSPEPSVKIVIAFNVDSPTYGKKDVLAIEGKDPTSKETDVISLVAPRATINIIADGKIKEKRQLTRLHTLEDVFKCPNRACPTNMEPTRKRTRFKVLNTSDIKRLKLQCTYCGTYLHPETIRNIVVSSPLGSSLVSRGQIEKTFLNLLLTKGALKIAPSSRQLFTLKSGRASPYFINMGSLTDGASLVQMKELLARYIALHLDEGDLDDFDFIFGPAYKGINLATLACEGLSELYGMNTRYLYDRKEEKAYGDVAADKIIVGADHFKAGQKILLIDDVTTTGETKLEALEKLKLLGPHTVVGLVLVVDRQERMGDAKTVGRKSAMQRIHEEFKVKVLAILDARTIFTLVKDEVPDDVREYWINYYAKYGAVQLSEGAR
jgi:orotate phosphoribosyltransferase